jgi:hypothetical protein
LKRLKDFFLNRPITALKICLIGNANNNDFAIARYLKALGHEPQILMNFKTTKHHFWPDKDSYYTEYTSYVLHKDWVQTAVIVKAAFLSRWRNLLIKDLSGFDLIIGNDMTPALSLFVNVPIFFLPTGSDIRTYSKFHSLKGRKLRPWIILNLKSYLFQKGIKKIAGIINTGYLPEVFEKLGVSSLCSKDFSLPIVYKEDVPLGYKGTECKRGILEKLKKEGNLIVFSHGRHRWNNNISIGETKGNEKLIRSIWDLKNNHPEIKLKIIFFEYGTDVNLSKKYIKDLGIEEYFVWFELDYRKNILNLLDYADLGIGQLDHIAFTSGVVNEFLACGVPVAQYIDPVLQTPYKDPYPYIQVISSEDLMKTFIELSSGIEKYKMIGEQGQKWFNDFAFGEISKMLAFYQKLV